jgi:tetratricopeptide (TPR) repeat protein
MDPQGRAELEARADRCVRRGEFSEAIDLYRELLKHYPDDEGLQRKLANLSESLQPNELQSGKAPRREPSSVIPASGPEQEGERLFALGDYAGAAAAYRRALQERPGSQLVRERLEEIFRIAQALPRNSPTDQPLPRDPEEKLRALLDRISARRRVRVS